MALYSPLRDAFKDLNRMVVDRQQWEAEHEARMAESDRQDRRLDAQMRENAQNEIIRQARVEEAQYQMTPQSVSFNSMLPEDSYNKEEFETIINGDKSGYSSLTALGEELAGKGSYYEQGENGEIRLYDADGNEFQAKPREISRIRQLQSEYLLTNLDDVKRTENQIKSNDRVISENEQALADFKKHTTNTGNSVPLPAADVPGGINEIGRINSVIKRSKADNATYQKNLSDPKWIRETQRSQRDRVIKFYNSLDPQRSPAVAERMQQVIKRLNTKIGDQNYVLVRDNNTGQIVKRQQGYLKAFEGALAKDGSPLFEEIDKANIVMTDGSNNFEVENTKEAIAEARKQGLTEGRTYSADARSVKQNVKDPVGMIRGLLKMKGEDDAGNKVDMPTNPALQKAGGNEPYYIALFNTLVNGYTLEDGKKIKGIHKDSAYSKILEIMEFQGAVATGDAKAGVPYTVPSKSAVLARIRQSDSMDDVYREGQYDESQVEDQRDKVIKLQQAYENEKVVENDWVPLNQGAKSSKQIQVELDREAAILERMELRKIQKRENKEARKVQKAAEKEAAEVSKQLDELSKDVMSALQKAAPNAKAGETRPVTLPDGTQILAVSDGKGDWEIKQ